MATRRDATEDVAIAVFSRAPLAGTTKTRLIPALGAVAAARMQRRLTLRAQEIGRAHV